MRFSLIFVFVLITVVFLSSDTEAEEEFIISVNPGWIGNYEIPGSCGEREMLDNNSDVLFPYYDCDRETGYTENITGTVKHKLGESNSSSESYYYLYNLYMNQSWGIGGVGDYYYYDETNLSVDTIFTFNLKGSNFNNQTQYTFLYKISTMTYTISATSSIEEPLGEYTLQDVINSSIVFFGNSSEVNYNLSGTLADKFSTLNQSAPDISNNCTQIYAEVVLKRMNTSTNSDEILASYSSAPFYTDKYTLSECDSYGDFDNYWSSPMPSLHFVAVLMVISFVSVRKTRLA